MDRVTKFKEAFKTGLAMVLVYGIALKLNWMNPYWAGWAVGMISLSTAGQSIHKGILRLAGTVPGCLSALVILSVAPQNRWLLLLLMCSWAFLTTYMMLIDKRHSYFWNVAGFVCLIILITGPGSSETLFTHAVYRTIETGMGVVVYTMVSVFLWPRTNIGALRNTGKMLASFQAELIQAGQEIMTKGTAGQKLNELHAQEVQQLAQFSQLRLAEGAESYEIYEMRHEWDRLHGLFAKVMENLDRWHISLKDLTEIDVNAIIPDLSTFFDELSLRFSEIQGVLNKKSPCHEAKTISLKIDKNALEGVSNLEKAALAVTRQELVKLEILTYDMLSCALVLAGAPALAGEGKKYVSSKPPSQNFTLPVPDPDQLCGAVFVSISIAVGFLIWIFINPPGHTGWFQFVGTVAMAVAGMPQIKATMLAKSVGLASCIGLLAYVFIMPQLSSFAGLGLLLFVSIFVVCYFFTGLARLAGIIGVINEISVSNPQVYNFAAMANGLIFTVAALIFVFGMSYLLRSPRPEKQVLHLVHRFFSSAAFLVARLEPVQASSISFFDRWRMAFHWQELTSLPGKITAWGHAINPAKFPSNTPEQIQGLTTALQTLVYRLDALYDAQDRPQPESFTKALDEEIHMWQKSMKNMFETWSRHPDAYATTDLKDELAKWLDTLEARIETLVEQTDKSKLSPLEGQHFFRLLGGVRGVTAAAVEFAGSSKRINWAQWREEMF